MLTLACRYVNCLARTSRSSNCGMARMLSDSMTPFNAMAASSALPMYSFFRAVANHDCSTAILRRFSLASALFICGPPKLSGITPIGVGGEATAVSGKTLVLSEWIF